MEFLYTLSLVPKPILISVLALVFMTELLPVILYSMFLMLTTSHLRQFWAMGYIAFAILMMLGSTVVCFIHAIQHPNHEKKISRFTTFLNLNFRRLYFQFFIEWIVRKEFLALLGTKVFSCVLILLVCLLYVNETYDERLLGMALSIAFTGNTFLLYQYHEFKNQHLAILRNLPLSLPKRFFYFCIVFIIICMPEFIVLHHNFPTQFGSIVFLESILFGGSILILLHGVLYRKHIDLEKFIQNSFIISFASVIIILFAMPWWIIILTNTAVGIFLFAKNYYAFESMQK